MIGQFWCELNFDISDGWFVNLCSEKILIILDFDVICHTPNYIRWHVFVFSEKIQQTVKIDASTVEIEERGVKLRLTVVDTPGFGDSLNSVDWYVVFTYDQVTKRWK